MVAPPDWITVYWRRIGSMRGAGLGFARVIKLGTDPKGQSS